MCDLASLQEKPRISPTTIGNCLTRTFAKIAGLCIRNIVQNIRWTGCSAMLRMLGNDGEPAHLSISTCDTALLKLPILPLTVSCGMQYHLNTRLCFQAKRITWTGAQSTAFCFKQTSSARSNSISISDPTYSSPGSAPFST